MEVNKDKQDDMGALILCSLTYVEKTAEDMERERYEAIDDESEQVRRWGHGNRIGECSKVISKQLQGSDVKDNQCFKRIQTNVEYTVMRIDVMVNDSYGNKYENMRFIVWGIKMYVFTRQWKQFSEDYKLISKKDSVNVWMFRDRLSVVIIPLLHHNTCTQRN